MYTEVVVGSGPDGVMSKMIDKEVERCFHKHLHAYASDWEMRQVVTGNMLCLYLKFFDFELRLLFIEFQKQFLLYHRLCPISDHAKLLASIGGIMKGPNVEGYPNSLLVLFMIKS